jgi:hypothetical protein
MKGRVSSLNIDAVLKGSSVALIVGRWPSPFLLKEKYQKFKNRNMLGRISVQASARTLGTFVIDCFNYPI